MRGFWRHRPAAWTGRRCATGLFATTRVGGPGWPPGHGLGARPDRDRRISRAGNARARKTLIQLAWLWLRYQPDSSLACWFRERVGNLQGRTRRIAIVAMARKLLIAIWRYAPDGIVPEGVSGDRDPFRRSGKVLG